MYKTPAVNAGVFVVIFNLLCFLSFNEDKKKYQFVVFAASVYSVILNYEKRVNSRLVRKI
jgi:hypothetical protein